MKLKMRKVKPLLRALRKRLEDEYHEKITECIFPKYQLKLMQDFIYSEKEREKIKKNSKFGIVKIGKFGIGYVRRLRNGTR